VTFMIESRYQVVTNHNVMRWVKQSEYFKANLGYAVTMENKGERTLNDKDHFAGSYNHQYKTTIYAQGSIGDIFFYVDYGILDDTIAGYHRLEEFVFQFDEKQVREKGISAYLGGILKSIDTQYAERMEKEKREKEILEKRAGSADKLTMNPGAVTYDDIKAYIQQKRI
jgi:hypothetical protein